MAKSSAGSCATWARRGGVIGAHAEVGPQAHLVDTVVGEGIGAELVRVIRKIAQVRRRLSEIEKEVTQIEKSELFELKAKVDKAATEGRDLLRDMALDLDSRVARARDHLKSLSIK